jgi:fructose-bisphosphate aldolase, class II
MLVDVFNARDTAPLAIDAVLEAGSHDPGPKASRIEPAEQWTPDKIIERAKIHRPPTRDRRADFDD